MTFEIGAVLVVGLVVGGLLVRGYLEIISNEFDLFQRVTQRDVTVLLTPMLGSYPDLSSQVGYLPSPADRWPYAVWYAQLVANLVSVARFEGELLGYCPQTAATALGLGLLGPEFQILGGGFHRLHGDLAAILGHDACQAIGEAVCKYLGLTFGELNIAVMS